jgi:hypothetical protein
MIRRKKNEGDSLELLLDTICNIFGGMILMTILVVLQGSEARQRLSQISENQVENDVQVRKLVFESNNAKDELQQLKKQRDILAQSYTASVPTDLKEIVQINTKSEAALSMAKVDLTKIENNISNCRTASTQLEYELNRISGEIKTASDAAKSKLQYTENLPRNIRLPLQRIDSKRSPRYYLVKGVYFYPFGYRGFSDQSEFRSEACLLKSESFLSDVIEVEPVKGAGWLVPQTGDTADYDSFNNTLNDCRPETHYAVFFVYGDDASFKSFQMLKSMALKKHYFYSVSPYGPNLPLLLSHGTPPIQ